MDNLSPVSGQDIFRHTISPGNTLPDRENTTATSVPEASRDTYDMAETTREERLRVFFDRTVLSVCDHAGMGSMALTGALTGVALGFSTMAGNIPVAIAGGIGAGAGILLFKTGWDKSLGRAAAKTISTVLSPVAWTARKIRQGFKKIIRSEKNQNPAGSVTSPTGEDLSEGLLNTGKVIRGGPKVIYPQISTTTAAEKAMIMETLDSLPLKDVTSADFVSIDPNLAKNYQASGMAKDLLFARTIDLDKGYAAINGFNREVLIHEVGHTSDFSKAPGPFLGRSLTPPFGTKPHIFDPSIDVPGELPYSATNRWEDYAQTYQFYNNNYDELARQTPVKLEAMEKIQQPTLVDKAVDRTGIRKFGKKLSEIIGRVPGLRVALNLAGSLIGPITLRTGTEKLKQGIIQGDQEKRFLGKMEAAQGIAYSSRFLSPLGLGLTGARWFLSRRVKKGKMSIEKAEKVAGTFLSAMAGPLGMISLAAYREMAKTKSSGVEKTSDMSQKAGEQLEYKEAKPRDFKEKLSYHLINLKPVEVTARAPDGTTRQLGRASLTRDEKKQVTKIAAGSFTAGAAGTAGGYFLGGLGGAALGMIIAGPPGAVTFGFLGKAVASMFGAYQGGKYGARLANYLWKPSGKEENPAGLSSTELKK